MIQELDKNVTMQRCKSEGYDDDADDGGGLLGTLPGLFGVRSSGTLPEL